MGGRTKSNTIAAMEKLRGLIFSGELAPENNYLESELAERLGMSRTPVREASLMLAGMGLLHIQPRKGVRINGITAHDMSLIYEVLTELECLSVRRAAQAGYNKADLAHLYGCIDAMDAAIAKDDRQAWAINDEAFHDELVRLGDNLHANQIVRQYNDRVRHARNLTLDIRPLPVQSNQDHRAVCEAIFRGNVKEAEEVHRTHRAYARVMLTDLLMQQETS